MEAGLAIVCWEMAPESTVRDREVAQGVRRANTKPTISGGCPGSRDRLLGDLAQCGCRCLRIIPRARDWAICPLKWPELTQRRALKDILG